ncbi:MAG TPA: proteasome accessory factor PafA2 family protein [Candidatus Margulisiibacteriota bacterium]|nr:proteasome accessory factor PafA2 family protein [Candidatus Margulisiibacteriota bacterium]
MTERLFGVETEYALTGLDARGLPIDRESVLSHFMALARARLPHIPDVTGRGLFLATGARFYIDAPDHPEFTTPECTTPWDVVRYTQAGERTLLGLASQLVKRERRIAEVVILRSNVDYSGSGSTWGTHESYLHRSNPRALPAHVIPHLVSRIIYTGAGGFNSRFRHGIEFTLSPRVPHLEHTVSEQSTQARGIFHTKDESLSSTGYHRLHILCGESVCSEHAAWLKVGTTALVLALVDGGAIPGDAVHLQSPLSAMQTFASDPTCTATAQASSGKELTALAIQRHYLAMVEARLDTRCMPPWARAVCRLWRATLDRLATAPDSMTTQLDWAMKLALFKRRAQQRGIAWESLRQWNYIAVQLGAALGRCAPRDERLSVGMILDEHGPVADEVRRLTPYAQTHGLEWSQLPTFIQLRQELFEIDTRFGQLGDKGIFTALDAAGVLAHRVDGVAAIAQAMEYAPAVGRAHLRGRRIRELTGNGERYVCDWHGLWDHHGARRLDLQDPFDASAEWQPWTPGEDCPF